MIKKFRKKPVVIEAVQWTGVNKTEIEDFTHLHLEYCTDLTVQCIVIPTLEGEHAATAGDYIIKGVQGEFYPCKPDTFEQTYDEVVEPEKDEELEAYMDAGAVCVICHYWRDKKGHCGCRGNNLPYDGRGAYKPK